MSWKKFLTNYSLYSKKQKGMWKYFLILLPYFLLIVFLVTIPMISIVVFSLSPDSSGEFHIGKFFTDVVTLQRFGLTLGMTMLSTFFCVILGLPAAWYMKNIGSVGKFIMLGLLTIPMWINMILRVKALNSLFLSEGVIELVLKAFNPSLEFDARASWPIVIVGLVFIFLPFMIIPIYNHVLKLDSSLALASMDLGASKLRTLFKVTIPLLYSSIHTGIILVFLQSATTIAISPILTDGKVITLGSRITRLYSSQKEYAAAISLVSLVFLLLMLSISSLINRKFKVKHATRDYVIENINEDIIPGA